MSAVTTGNRTGRREASLSGIKPPNLVSLHEKPYLQSHYSATCSLQGVRSKAPERIQLARCTLNRYLLILKRLILESSVRAGSPSLVAAPEGPETRP